MNVNINSGINEYSQPPSTRAKIENSQWESISTVSQVTQRRAYRGSRGSLSLALGEPAGRPAGGTTKKGNKKIFMAHVYPGDPDLDFSRRLIRGIERHIDILEMGIPYADPLADGSVFQQACMRALKNGVSVNDIFQLAQELTGDGFLRPIVLTTYYNIVFQVGHEAFVQRLVSCGISGLIVPDLPLEESDELYETCRAQGIHLIYLVTPTTTPERLARIVARATGFIYLVAVTGVTGTGKTASDHISQIVEDINRLSNIPVLMGFGISTPEQVRQIPNVDGVIVGSAICRKYTAEGIEPAVEFVRAIKEACGC